jgi:NADH pyrophosphatase NudC (nudix superfamily)
MELNILEAYKYCPRCGKQVKHLHTNLLKCQSCSFNFYVNSSPTAGIYILNKNKEVLLVRRAIEPRLGTWDSLGGFINLNENYEQAAIREAKEELGIQIEIGEFISINTLQYPYQGINVPIINIDFTARIVSGTPHPADDIDEYKYFDIEEALTLDLAFESIRKSLSKLKQKLNDV